MADETPISLLPPITNAALSDLTTAVQGGVTYKVSNEQLLELTIDNLGTAATKDVSNDTYTTVPALTGESISGGDLVMFSFDEDGSLKDSGIPAIQVMITTNDLSDLSNVYNGRKNIFGQENNGFVQLDVTGADVVLVAPAPNTLNISNNNGTTSITLPVPSDLGNSLSWQPGSWVLWDNALGSNGVPIKQYDGTPLMTLLASSVYLMYVKNTAGDVAFLKIV